MAVARSPSLESMEDTNTADSDRYDAPTSGVRTANRPRSDSSESARSFPYTVMSRSSSDDNAASAIRRTPLNFRRFLSLDALSDVESDDVFGPDPAASHHWPRDVIVALAGASGSDVLEIQRVLGEAIDRTCGWGENPAKKEKRVAKLRADNEKNRSSGRRFSRACRVCLVADPRERVAFVACGHASCRACADCLPRCDAESARVACPLCRARTYYVRLFELPKKAAGAQQSHELPMI